MTDLNELHPNIKSFAATLVLGIDYTKPEFADLERRGPLRELAAALAPRLRKAIFTPPPTPMPPDARANHQNRFSRVNETTKQLAERCINEARWVSVGREYAFPDGPDYTISPEPSLNTAGLPFGEWTWQFNRHNEWAVIARLHEHSPDPRYPKAVAGWMRRWLEQCPPPAFDYDAHQGTWRTIEIGIRLGQTWPHVLTAFLNEPAIDDVLLLAWLGAWAEQAAFAWRHRKSANWLMMEVAGILSAGVCLPFHRDAPYWRQQSLDVMRAEADTQFYRDGMQIELSANYHMVCVHQYRIARDLLRSAHYPAPDWLDALLKQIYKPMRAMVRPDGYVFGFQDTTPIYLPDVLKSLPAELRESNDDWYVTGKGTAPSNAHDVLPNSGYVVLRSGRSESDLAIAFDGGPYGAAHQHEDMLGFQLFAHGTELIGEAGLVDYADSPERSYSLSTLAHSTAIVDGLGQSRGHGYSKRSIVLDQLADTKYDLNSDMPWARATYDAGYGPRGALKVAHTRTVTLFDEDTVVIHDRFRAEENATHKAEILFHVLVEPATIEGQSLITRGPQGNIAITPMRPGDGDLATSVITGGTTPDLRGWAQRSMTEFTGTWDPAPRPCLTVSASFTNDLEVITVLRTFAPGQTATPAPAIITGRSLRIGDRSYAIA